MSFALVMDSAKEVSYVLRLALSDLGANADGLPSEGASTVDFTKWSQQTGGAVADAAGSEGKAIARDHLQEQLAKDAAAEDAGQNVEDNANQAVEGEVRGKADHWTAGKEGADDHPEV
uniref:Uncharacterized protein n=1 Tax=Oryza punctata TaxID=4537 RepID=A0A0E0M7F5_ORYPU